MSGGKKLPMFTEKEARELAERYGYVILEKSRIGLVVLDRYMEKGVIPINKDQKKCSTPEK